MHNVPFTRSQTLAPVRLMPAAGWVALSLPLLFIVLWSSGYVLGKMGLAYAGPFTLLSLRFGLAASMLLAISLLTGAPWPKRGREWGHLVVVGLLMQVLQFVGVYEGMRLGLPSGIAALLIGMMPLATSLGAHLWLAERIGRWQGLGLVGGLAGVLLVVAGKPFEGHGGWLPYALALLGLLGLVGGTLYQKRFCAGMDLRSGASIQMTVSTAVVVPLAWHFEGFAVQWSGEMVFATLWLALVNSIGAFTLLFLMVRRGQASQVARLFYLIPGVSALMGFVVLGEQLQGLALLGFVVSALAVSLGVMPTVTPMSAGAPSNVRLRHEKGTRHVDP
jgi:drug/metabolite transporter (DMT)-like permease